LNVSGALLVKLFGRGGDESRRFAERARAAARLGALGHHTHWTSPTHARPTGGHPAARVVREGESLRLHGLEPRVFCGGGWYVDADVLEAAVSLGYADCTATSWRPRYLPPGSPRAALSEPAWVRLPGGKRVLELPTTHSLGMLLRALPRRLPRHVHVHFHDYELLDARRAAALRALLALLARRRVPRELTELAAEREVDWGVVCAG
jgi:hypothetical protein